VVTNASVSIYADSVQEQQKRMPPPKKDVMQEEYQQFCHPDIRHRTWMRQDKGAEK